MRYTAEPAPASLGVGDGHWCVMLGETFVAGYWTDPDIARDYAYMMNAARAGAGTDDAH